MKHKHFIATLSFIFLSLIAACQGETSEKSKAWLEMLRKNAIGMASAGTFSKAQPGYALYFSQAGAIRAPYIVYVPKGYNAARPISLIVFLHGAILARDSFQYKDPAIADEPVFSVSDDLNALVVFPFARADFAWGRQTAANENIMSIITLVQQTYNVDKKRIYIGGISMGGNATYWFVNNRASVFAGFYAFSSMPELSEGIHFGNITPEKPLYTMNAKDDQGFSYSDVAAIYEQHKKAVPGWHFYSVENGGHRFIYGNGGNKYIKQLLGMMVR